MNRQSMFQAKKESQPLQTSSLFRRQAAQAPVEEREAAALPINLGRDFSGIPFKPVHPAPALGPSSISCPFTPERCPFGGACHACPPKIQAKLKIGQPGDRYEQEADRVAEQVMRMPEPQAQRKGCSAPGCKDEEEKKLLQTKPASAGEAGAQVDHPLIQSVLSSPGQPLDAGTRSFMEPRFGQDFSGVRVHVGGQAAESARAVNARAYTVGRDVVFGEGQYAPGSDEGKRLVAHELVHVGQQLQSNLIQLSPLSNQLQQVWNTQGKGVFFEQLRTLSERSDSDLLAFIQTNLTGDDLWLAQNLFNYGYEADWPIHLRVEREMKGWRDSGGKVAVFNILRAANGTKANNDQLSISINRIFESGTDDIWLAQKIQAYGPEPRWPLADITERQRRATTNSWAGEHGDIRGVLGSGNHQVEAYYFRGASDRRALIIGGVHGSEPGGVEVVRNLLSIMRSPNAIMPFFSVIIVPELFSANVHSSRPNRRTSGGRVGAIVSGCPTTVSSPDPNRQFPAIGAEPVSNTRLGCIIDEQQRCVEPENLVLLDLVNRFQPERVASVHGHGNTGGNMDQLLKGGGPSITTDPRPGHEAEDDALALSMATAAQRLGVRIPGNFMGDPKKQRTRYPTGTAPRTSNGVTFGQWGSHSTPTRPAMNIILIETFGNTTSNSPSLNDVQRVSRRAELMNLAQILRDFFLGKA